MIRYNVVIGYAARDLPRGSWVNERVIEMPPAPALDDLPICTRAAGPMAPLEGYTFEGFRNADGSVGTRNILAITTTVQCVSGVVEHAVRRIKAELLPRYPNVDDVIGLEHTYGCGVAIDAPDAAVPIRTLRNIALNPNFGGTAMMVSLGCEAAARAPAAARHHSHQAGAGEVQVGVVCLQDEQHVGFGSMIAAIMEMAETHGQAERAPPRDLPGLRHGGRRAVRRQRRLLRRDGQSGGGFCHRPAGARRCRGDVLGSDRGARRHRPAHRARRRPRWRRR